LSGFDDRLNWAEKVLRLYVTLIVTLLGLLCDMLVFWPVCWLAASRTTCPFFAYVLYITSSTCSLFALVPHLSWLQSLLGNFTRHMRTSSPAACHVTLVFEFSLVAARPQRAARATSGDRAVTCITLSW
jgi:hypothetical protein